MVTPGVINVAVDGPDNNSIGYNVGYLWHRYRVQLLDPTAPTVVSISYLPEAPSVTIWDAFTFPATASKMVAQVPLGLPLCSTDSTIFSNSNWPTATATSWLKVATAEYGFMPMPCSFGTQRAAWARWDDTGTGTVFTLPPKCNVSVGCTGSITGATETAFSNKLKYGVALFYQTPTQVASNQTSDFAYQMVCAEGVGNGTNNQVFNMANSTNTVLTNASTVPYRCWLGISARTVDNSAPSNTGHTITWSASTIENILIIDSGVMFQNRKSARCGDVTNYDLQTQSDLWMPLFEAGASGTVSVVDEEKKEVPPEDFKECVSQIQSLKAELAEMRRSRLRVDEPVSRGSSESGFAVVSELKENAPPRRGITPSRK